MKNQKKTYVDELTTENAKFCIIALTGKVRAGTSDVCKLLTNPEFPDLATRPANTCGYDMREIRENLLVYRFLHHQWKPFIHLSITDIIVSFIFDSRLDTLKESYIDTFEKNSQSIYDVLSECIKKVSNTIEEVIKRACKISTTLLNANGVHDFEIITQINKTIRKTCIDKYQGFNIESLMEYWQNTRDRLDKKETVFEDLLFCFGYLAELRIQFRETLGKNNYTIAFQKFGNNIRALGKAVANKDDERDIQKVFSLPERANKFVKLLRFYKPHQCVDAGTVGDRAKKNSVFIVINNFKNIFEAYYFKKRYSAFYLIAVSCDEQMRIAQFEDMTKFRLAELRENLSAGKRLYNRVQPALEKNNTLTPEAINKLGLNEAETQFIEDLIKPENELIKNVYDNNISSFILQDAVTCVENADIFVKRNYLESDYKCDYPLIHQLARIITLILHPGLLTPTKIEQCMQIAMSAKLNSGCLSRQVGAVVTDQEYNILSLGWNDAPCGDESCIRRNLYDLLRKHDYEAYSEYELSDDEFRKYLDTIKEDLTKRKDDLQGLPLAFCFKDIYQDMIKQRDQIYTRALHGEERALVACDREKAKGGYLFTTSSPCELCAKKAKEAKIKKIYYIEQYPGISRSHIINYGRKDTRADYELFVGAVGAAYMKLYTPVIPYKDELAILNFSPRAIHAQIIRNIPDNSKKDSLDNKNHTLVDHKIKQISQINQDN